MVFIVPQRQTWNTWLCCLLCSAISRATGNLGAGHGVSEQNTRNRKSGSSLEQRHHQYKEKHREKYRNNPCQSNYEMRIKMGKEKGGRAGKENLRN